MGGVQDGGPVRTTDTGFSVSNIADIYADNTVTQRCQNRRPLPATLGTQACCRCLLPPLFIIYEIMSNFLRRSSTHLSCEHMLFQPSAHGSLPCVCQKDAGCCAGPLQGHTDQPTALALRSGLGGAGTCLFCPLTQIASR